ncbi:MAG: class I SAM-dependent methyltransferase [Patescibacteria group bacterium]|nr:class I SAM-dependent methyltransferase [Patescibacteria group bacterium]
MSDKRFEGVLGDEYELFKLALPYYDELEETIGRAVREHSAGLTASSIVVVEGGCGTGLTTRQLLQADPRVHVLAIDNEPIMLVQTCDNVKDEWNRIEFRRRDLLMVLRELQTGSMDVFASGYLIHNLTPQYRRDLYAEISRVLKPGGLFVNGDKCVRDDPVSQVEDYRMTIAAYDIYDTIGRSDYKAEWIEHYEEDELVRFTEAEQRGLLSANGFSDVRLVKRFGMDSVMTAMKA